MKSNTAAAWQSGKLVPQRATRSFEFSRRHWLGATLLLLSAVVLALFVAVLEQDVDRNGMRQMAQRSRAEAQAPCDSDPSSQARERCIAGVDGNDVGDEAGTGIPPENRVGEHESDTQTAASLVSTAR